MRGYIRARVDGNHGEIVKALRRAGCFVAQLFMVGGGMPDIAVARAGLWYFIEIKKPGGKLTKDQKSWIADLDGRAAIHVVESPEQALRAVGL